MNNYIKSKKGFTILEILVSMTIFIVISLPIISVMSNSISISNKSFDEINVNALLSNIKVAVYSAVKNDNFQLPLYDTDGEIDIDGDGKILNEVRLPTESEPETDDIGIVEANKRTNIIKGYRYNITFLSDVPDALNTSQYQIKVFKEEGKNWNTITSIILNINKLPE